MGKQSSELLAKGSDGSVDPGLSPGTWGPCGESGHTPGENVAVTWGLCALVLVVTQWRAKGCVHRDVHAQTQVLHSKT